MSTTFFRCLNKISFALALLALLGRIHAQDASPAPPSLREQLEAQYPLATFSTAIGSCQVNNPETVLMVQKAGLCAVPAGNFSPKLASQYKKDGTLEVSKVCTGETKTNKMLKFYNKLDSRVNPDVLAHPYWQLAKQAEVYPSQIEVTLTEVRFTFAYCTDLGYGKSALYKGQIVFAFDKDFLKPENVTQVEGKVAEVFSPPAEHQQAQAGQQTQESGGQQPQDQQQQPQNQASACNPEVGQTLAQVEEACGKPASQAKGANGKQIYNYSQPKLKIIFISGKVFDIE
jgi:hypothetical protein